MAQTFEKKKHAWLKRELHNQWLNFAEDFGRLNSAQLASKYKTATLQIQYFCFQISLLSYW